MSEHKRDSGRDSGRDPGRVAELAAGPFPPDFDPAGLELSDPDPWLALYLDQSVPIDDSARVALLRSMRRPSRSRLLPFVRPLARTFIVLFTVIRILIPNRWHSSARLHRLIHWGLKTFVAPEANYLILRHFHIGSEILAFIADNVPGFKPDTVPLYPNTLEDLIDDVFLQHDLNIFLFIAQMNAHLRRQGRDLAPRGKLNFRAITDAEFPIETLPEGRWNVVDLQTAIEAYTPLYQLFLRNSDFWRASNSLQLDETVGVYVAKLLGSPYHLFFANNRHPVIPLSTLRAGFRLMLHGLAAEQLHYHLRQWKRGALDHLARTAPPSDA